MDRISELPLEILQGILYFLSQEEAVRTSVLSKSWRHIGCTRPNLDFSYDTFKGNGREFLSIVDKNLQRYCDQRLRVEEFHLRISFDDYYLNQLSVLILEKWIPLLRNMGVKKFCLSLPSEIRNEYGPPNFRPKLSSIVFGAESLQELHLDRFQLDQNAIERIAVCKNLKSLGLVRVLVEEEIFQKIISSCPLIETMNVKLCERLRTFKLNDLQNLKHFSVSGMYVPCSIELYAPSLETIDITFGNLRFHKGADFRNLNRLHISGANMSWDNLQSCKFPSLKSLHISYCHGFEETQLFIDAPNIIYFKYKGNFVPSISFATTSKKWKSDIDLPFLRSDGPPSVVKLKEQLKSLSQSEISLTIFQFHKDGKDVIQEYVNAVQDINDCHKHVVVESLRLRLPYTPLPYPLSYYISSLLNCGISICRPRIIGEYGLELKRDREWIECLWKILMQREVIGNEDQFSQLWLRDLEEVKFEINDSIGKEWRPASLSELPNYQESKHVLTRFALKWRDYV